MQLEHTIGTCVGPTGRPMPRLSSSRATPLAASRPKADPPERQTAWTLSTVFSGSQQVGFARCWSTAANVNAAGGALGCHDYGATGSGLLVRIVAIAKAIDIADVNGLEQCIHV